MLRKISDTPDALPSSAASVATILLDNPDALLTRNQLAAALTARGFPTASATLASKATRGGGPPFRRFGARPLYRWGDALDWAQSRLSAPVRSTSELHDVTAA